MLIGKLDSKPIEAWDAERGLDYRCPNPKCNSPLILKQGRIMIHHFAHKPPKSCDWAKGETTAHLNAKRLVRDALQNRGLRAEAEFVVGALPGDRRADMMTWRPDGLRVAIELQHTPLSLREIEARANSYARAGIAQIWIPFLRPGALSEATHRTGGLFVERYSPRPYEKWVHGFNGKEGMWMYFPPREQFFLGKLRPHQLYVEESSWYSEGGDEQSAGGFYRNSKRYRDLYLTGPFSIDDLRFKLKTWNKPFSRAVYNWPACKVAQFTPPSAS